MPQLITLSLADLHEHATQWNDLWQRSEAEFPTVRAEGIRLWCESFAPKARFAALVVVEGDRFVAALPLIADKAYMALTVYRLPTNCTVNAADLLIDPSFDVDLAISLLTSQLCELPSGLAAFDNIRVESDRWQRLLEALAAAKREIYVSPGHEVGVIDVFHDWDAYIGCWSRNHRRSSNRAKKKLEASGEVKVCRLQVPSDEELDEVLEACWKIEDSGWKGENGTSILKTPVLREYYHQEARLMRDLGMLDLWLLKLDGELIAFDYSLLCKQTSLSFKISFDPVWEKCSPGRALQMYQMEQYHQDPNVTLVDTLGFLCEVKAKWTTRSYRSSNCFIAVGGHGTNMLLRSAKRLKRWVNRIRPTDVSDPQLKHGAAKYLEFAPSAEEGRLEPPVVALPVQCPPVSPASHNSPS